MLEPILHQEFWIVRSKGVRQDKEQMIEGLASAPDGCRVIRKELIEPYGRDSAIAMTLINYYDGDSFVGARYGRLRRSHNPLDGCTIRRKEYEDRRQVYVYHRH